jgi:hypothetical protein
VLEGADQRRREKRVSDPGYGNQEDTLHELILFDSAVVGNCSGDRATRTRTRRPRGRVTRDAGISVKC